MKTFDVPTRVTWTKDRCGTVQPEGKAELAVSAPPEFHGPAGVWTPEDLFVAALETCLMLTFVSLCQDAGLELVSYSSTASGRLEKTPDGLAFGWVVISPVIEARCPEQQILELINRASDLCMIRRSAGCQVAVYPEVHGSEGANRCDGSACGQCTPR